MNKLNLTIFGLAVAIVSGSVGLELMLTGAHKKATTTTKAVITQTTPFAKSNKIIDLPVKDVEVLKIPAEQVVVLAGEVSDNAYSIASAITNKTEDGKPVYLLINSPGGSVLQGALIISAMESANAPVYTVCLQLCASMAAIIHQYGYERLMLDRSILMFHDAAGGMQGYFSHMRAEFDTIDRYVNKFEFYIAQRAGLDPEAWMNTVYRNKWIDGEDAVDSNFAEKLVFIKVESNGKLLNIESLLPLKSRPKLHATTSPVNPSTIFDVEL